MLTGAVAEACARWLGFGGTVLLAGAALTRFVLLREAASAPPLASRLRRLAGAAAACVVLGALARLVQQAAAFSDAPGEWLATVPVVITGMTWGIGWLLQAVGALTAIGSWRRMARGRVASITTWGALALLCAAPAFSGHAAGSERFTAQAVVADVVHVAAAGAWMGPLVVLGLAWNALGAAGPDAGALLTFVRRFSPLAQAGVIALGATGLFASWLHVGSVANLLTSAYGRLLIAKLALVCVAALLGAWHWRVLTPRLAALPATSPAGVSARRSLVLEAAAGIAVLGVTSVLVATAFPGEG